MLVSRQEEASFSLTEVLATPGGAGGGLGPELEINIADNGLTSLHRSLVSVGDSIVSAFRGELTSVEHSVNMCPMFASNKGEEEF